MIRPSWRDRYRAPIEFSNFFGPETEKKYDTGTYVHTVQYLSTLSPGGLGTSALQIEEEESTSLMSQA